MGAEWDSNSGVFVCNVEHCGFLMPDLARYVYQIAFFGNYGIPYSPFVIEYIRIAIPVSIRKCRNQLDCVSEYPLCFGRFMKTDLLYFIIVEIVVITFIPVAGKRIYTQDNPCEQSNLSFHNFIFIRLSN